METVAIIDYGSGNLRSAAKAFERVIVEEGLSARVALTDDPAVVRGAGRVVLPGVGAFADCRRGLGAVEGMVEALERRVIAEGAPFLGICVGMQLMAGRGLEFGVVAGLGWIPGDVVALERSDPSLRIPHMGWNALRPSSAHPVLEGVADGEHVYFVHSYHLVPTDPAHVLATAEHGAPFAAMVGRDNLVGTQFHPEKSQAVGLRLIANFLRWAP